MRLARLELMSSDLSYVAAAAAATAAATAASSTAAAAAAWGPGGLLEGPP